MQIFAQTLSKFEVVVPGGGSLSVASVTNTPTHPIAHYFSWQRERRPVCWASFVVGRITHTGVVPMLKTLLLSAAFIGAGVISAAAQSSTSQPASGNAN